MSNELFSALISDAGRVPIAVGERELSSHRRSDCGGSGWEYRCNHEELPTRWRSSWSGKLKESICSPLCHASVPPWWAALFTAFALGLLNMNESTASTAERENTPGGWHRAEARVFANTADMKEGRATGVRGFWVPLLFKALDCD